ncbi:hypothetical protein B0H19DRAFT_1273619 [Mycena capillaripes]|nr:hypothetical protein B0H19DRAFT_1273619 [Mycena capillaripes]
MNTAEAFAAATGQGCHVYHAKDNRVGGRKRRQLNTGLVAEVAWAVPVKEANDLGRKVPYVPGMPVFCTENIATELGISKGSPGTPVSVIFDEVEGRRYAIYVGYCYAKDGRHLRDVDDKKIRPADIYHFDDKQLAGNRNHDLLLLRCMNDILPKPFTRDGLLDVLEKHLAHLTVIKQQMATSMIPRAPTPSNDMGFANAFSVGAVTLPDSTLNYGLGLGSPELGDHDGRTNMLAGMGCVRYDLYF